MADISLKLSFAHMLLFMFSWLILMHIFWSIQGMLSEQHCSGCTKFSNKVKVTDLDFFFFFSSPKWPEGFGMWTLKDLISPFFALLNQLIVLLMGKKFCFFIFAASLHLPSLGCDVLKHALSFEDSLSRGQNVRVFGKTQYKVSPRDGIEVM